MKLVRLLLLILAVCAAGFLAFRGLRGPDAKPLPPPPGEDPASPGKSVFEGLHGDEPPVKPMNGATNAPPAPVEKPPPGIPVGATSEVSVVVPYRTGLKSRYRITEAQLTKYREHDLAAWWQFIWKVSTEVTSGDGTGAARIQLRVNSFRYRTEKDGQPVDFDSEKPDDKLLADDVIALSVRPRMATLGMPLEFTLDAAGRITNIEGVEAMNRKYLDAVDAIGAKYVADAIEAPATDGLIERWSELLFPAVGGKTMKGSDARGASFRTTYFERWAALSKGTFRVTHTDGDTFRIAFTGRTDLEERPVEPKAPSSRALAKVHVQSSDDSYRNAWTFDSVKGRLVGSFLSAKYQVWVSRPLGPDASGEMQYEPTHMDLERMLEVELLGD